MLPAAKALDGAEQVAAVERPVVLCRWRAAPRSLATRGQHGWCCILLATQ